MTAVALYQPVVPEDCEWVRLDHQSDYNITRDLEANRVGASWRAMPVHLLTHDEHTGRPLRKSLLPWFGRDFLVLRDEAIESIGPLLDRFAELLPLSCPDADLLLLNVTNVVDILDEEESEIVRFPSTRRIMKITHHSFKGSLIPPQAFKLPQMRRGAVYLTHDLVSAIESFGFLGTNFTFVGEVPTAP